MRWFVAAAVFAIVTGRLFALDDPAAKNDDPIPDEVRAVYDRAVADQPRQIKLLKAAIANCDSSLREDKANGRTKEAKADQDRLKAFRKKLDQIKKMPAPPELEVPKLAAGQIGPLTNDRYDIREIKGETKVVLALVTEEDSYGRKRLGRRFAVSGVPTKGLVTGGRLAVDDALAGLYIVEGTELYGSRTIFSLTPYDAKKLQGFFERLKAEKKAAPAKEKAKPEGDDGGEKDGGSE